MEYRRNSKPMTAEERVEASKQSASVRQALMETMLVPYPQFRDGIKFIRKFHVPVEGGTPSVGRIGGLLGESRVGKTVICNYFVSENPPSYDDEGESYPVVYVQASDEMKLPSLADRICIATGARSLTVKHKLVVDATLLRLAAAKTQLLIIDDAHFMYDGRNQTDRRNFISFVKMVADQKLASILLVGEDSILDTIDATPTLSGRGFVYESLRAFSKDDEKKNFRNLLLAVEDRLPFAKHSNFIEKSIADDLHRFSGGLIGRLVNLIRQASYFAIDDGSAYIMREHLRDASRRLVPAHSDRSYRYFEIGARK
jgi:hypothetical protein